MKILIKVLAVIFLVLALNACTKKGGHNMGTDPNIGTGGTVDRSFDAPKEIKSKDLTAMDSEFFYTIQYKPFDCARMHIKLVRNEKNELILSEEDCYNVSVKVGDEVLKGAQELIEKFELSKLNGTDKYTSGLPEPYSLPMYFKAEYESGESIYFSMNSRPNSSWCNELAYYFLDVFEEYGETSVLPPRESVQISRLDIAYFDGALYYLYYSEISEKDEVQLFKGVYEYERKNVYKGLCEKYIDVPENYYSELENFLKELKAYTLINGNNEDIWATKTPGVKSFDICIEHPDLSHNMGSFEGEEITPEILEKTQKLINFIDKYFEQ